MNSLEQYLKEAKVFYLATMRETGPSNRPIGGKPGFEGDGFLKYEGKYYFYTDNRKLMYKELSNNPNIAMTFMVSGGYVRVFAAVEFIDNVELKEQFLNENPVLKQIYKADDQFFELYYLNEVNALLYAPMKEPMKLE
ncbi:MAG: pyridoxamine 5'-phosphate oxidase family protein [Candidatus Izemoplasmatales bacterium]